MHEVPQEFKGGRHQLCLGCRGSFTEEGLLALRQEGGAGGAMEQSLLSGILSCLAKTKMASILSSANPVSS